MPSPGVEPGLPKPQSGVLPLYYKGVALSIGLSGIGKHNRVGPKALVKFFCCNTNVHKT